MVNGQKVNKVDILGSIKSTADFKEVQQLGTIINLKIHFTNTSCLINYFTGLVTKG